VTGIEAMIPFGYEDETGFHYGVEFISSLLKSSAIWKSSAS